MARETIMEEWVHPKKIQEFQTPRRNADVRRHPVESTEKKSVERCYC
jgi:hypothetical protein